MKRTMCSPVALMALISTVCWVPNLQASDRCSDATFTGSYGFTQSGAFVGVGPAAAVGQLTADGKGTVTGAETFSTNGSISRDVTFTATYHVNPDCTGSATFNEAGGQGHLDFVMVDGGREQYAIETDAGSIITITATRINAKAEQQE